MKKKIILLSILMGIIFLTGCDSRKDLLNYVSVKFWGMNTEGVADYAIDHEKLAKDLFNFDKNSDSEPDEKTLKEMANIEDAVKIKLSKSQHLSNGDKVKLTITVDKDKTSKVKGGEKTFTVSGLKKPKILSKKEIEKNVVVNFNGVSGRGEAKIDTTFSEPLDTLEFKIKNDGKLKNGDNAILILTKEAKNTLKENGYKMENKEITFPVKGLKEVAQQANDIANLNDIKRMISEGIKREYKDWSPEEDYGTRYEIKQEKLFYRQFEKETSNEEGDMDWYSSTESNNGTLVGVYTIKKYSGGTEGKLEEQYTVVYGYTNLILDNNKKVNVTEIDETVKKYDDTYSLESVLKLMEGYGYSEVK